MSCRTPTEQAEQAGRKWRRLQNQRREFHIRASFFHLSQYCIVTDSLSVACIFPRACASKMPRRTWAQKMCLCVCVCVCVSCARVECVSPLNLCVHVCTNLSSEPLRSQIHADERWCCCVYSLMWKLCVRAFHFTGTVQPAASQPPQLERGSSSNSPTAVCLWGHIRTRSGIHIFCVLLCAQLRFADERRQSAKRTSKGIIALGVSTACVCVYLQCRRGPASPFEHKRNNVRSGWCARLLCAHEHRERLFVFTRACAQLSMPMMPSVLSQRSLCFCTTTQTNIHKTHRERERKDKRYNKAMSQSVGWLFGEWSVLLFCFYQLNIWSFCEVFLCYMDAQHNILTYLNTRIGATESREDLKHSNDLTAILKYNTYWISKYIYFS